MERPQRQPQEQVKDRTKERGGKRCEFTVTQERLTDALRLLGGVAGKNPILPILSSVLLKSDGGQLRLATTDLEVGITVWLAGHLQGSGALAVPFRTLAEYLQNIPAGPVTLELGEGALTISARSPEKAAAKESHAVLQGETAENYPLLPHLPEGIEVPLPKGYFVQALERVVYAVATEDTRPELAGVLLRASGGTLTLAATDSYRLAEVSFPLTVSLASPVSVIIPIRAAQEVRRVLERGDEAVLRVGENQLLFFTPTVQLVSRRVEGTYPDYAQVIPEKTPTTVIVDRADLLRAIRATAAFSEHAVSRVTLEVSTDSVAISAVSPEIGESRNTLAAEVSGEGLTISFNARFLRDALTVLPGERVRMGLGGATTPAVFRVAEEAPPDGGQGKHQRAVQGPEVLALVMPVKL